jgi:hypothetical protein
MRVAHDSIATWNLREKEIFAEKKSRLDKSTAQRKKNA